MSNNNQSPPLSLEETCPSLHPKPSESFSEIMGRRLLMFTMSAINKEVRVKLKN